MQTPLISFVMPTYNAGRTVKNAIGSILDQTIGEWELIVVDDGSKDNTVEEIQSFLGDPRIKYFRFDENKGIVAARNFGNSQASGEYIAMQDADDVSLPNRLERGRDEFSSADVILHGIYMNLWDRQFERMKRIYVSPVYPDRQTILERQYIPGVCVFKKSLWEKHPFREETKYAFDWMMHIDWIMNGAQYHCIYEGLYDYIRQQDSASIRYERDGLREASMQEIKRIVSKEYAS